MTKVVDYDANGYDYRDYWRDRAFEHWAEGYALRRLLTARRLGPPGWFADFGGGFGRNAPRYLDPARVSVLLDYSPTNLRNAADLHADAVAAGRLHLVRADLNALPFRDFAFDSGMVLRVLHHLGDLTTCRVDAALAEMGRTVGGSWIVDVPIKHHVLALLRAARDGDLARVTDSAPVLVGADEPYWNHHLGSIRDTLRRDGWRSKVAASVNNFRRWERVAPARLRPALAEALRPAEALGQRLGRGWWGPSQLLLARRYDPISLGAEPALPGYPAHQLSHLAPALRGLARRMVCPQCVRALAWQHTEAYCAHCEVGYRQLDGYWDFVTAHSRTTPIPAHPAALPPHRVTMTGSPHPRRRLRTPARPVSAADHQRPGRRA